MQIKYMLFILTLTLLVPLIFIGFFQDYEQYNDIVLIIPNSNYTVDVPIEKIEKVNEEKFLTTYLVEQEKKIRAIHEHHLVSIKGTNYAYPFVLNYNIVNGGFFQNPLRCRKAKLLCSMRMQLLISLVVTTVLEMKSS